MQKAPTTIFISLILSMLFLLQIKNVNSTTTNTKLWAVGVMTGPLAKDSPFQYYLEPQLRLIDNKYVLNQVYFIGGIGYQFTPDLTGYIGPGWTYTKNNQGIVTHEIRYWEQLSWRIVSNSKFNLNGRTRLEERQNTDISGISIRFRERLWMRIPFTRWPTHSFSCYDEVFFNLNHPKWVSPYLFEQNRAFIGIGTQLSHTTILDVGYLNQYIHSRNNQIDNVLLVSFTVAMV